MVWNGDFLYDDNIDDDDADNGENNENNNDLLVALLLSANLERWSGLLYLGLIF